MRSEWHAVTDHTAVEFVGQCEPEIPLVIMTSDDTHESTLLLLESNYYFGMKTTQVKLIKQVIISWFFIHVFYFVNGTRLNFSFVLTICQEKVACLTDNDARFALDLNDKYKIQVTSFCGIHILM